MTPSSQRNRANAGFSRRRLFVCVAVFCVFFAVVVYRAFDLQVLNTGKAFEHAKNQQTGHFALQSKRGRIFDSNGFLIASSRLSYSSYLIPGKIEDPESFSLAVSEISGLDYEFVLSRALKKNRSFVWMKRKMSPDVFEKLGSSGLEGLLFKEEQKRVYPHGYLLGPVVGFTDTDLRGIEGLEYSLNKYLTGKNIKIKVTKDGRGGSMLFHTPDVLKETGGADVFLTIDSKIQYIVEQELGKGVEKVRAQSGSAVLMDPHTGRILAMASYPFFDPNRFRQYSQAGMRNLPVSLSFEPGSIMKPFLAAAAMEEGFVDAKTVFDCENGKRKIGSFEIRDTSPHGRLTVTDTIVFSSNICASKIAEVMGAGLYHRYLRNFGFGSKSGTMIPGEHKGIVPHPKRWGRLGLATIAFGQGVSVNALQMAAAVSSIANGGYLMAPHIVDRVVDSSGNLLLKTTPKVERKVVSYGVAGRVAEIMAQAVERGTGTRAGVRGYRVGGKTGTAQVADPQGSGYMENSYTASFVGFAPVENPRLALVVVVNRPQTHKYGSRVAAPIFGAILKRTLGMLEIQTASAGSPEQFLMPDLRGKSVRDVALWAEKSGVDLRVSGHGFARKHSPAPGVPVKKGQRCLVFFGRSSI